MMPNDPNKDQPVEKKKLTVSEEEIEQAVESAAKEVEEEGAVINIACSV